MDEIINSMKMIQAELSKRQELYSGFHASILSAIKEIEGSCSDEKLAIAILDRIIGIESN